MTTTFEIGDYTITAVLDNPGAPRDPSQVMPTVPAEAWDPYRSFALDSSGMWVSYWRGHLVRATSGEGPVILIDTGMGPAVQDHNGEQGQLLRNLSVLGVQPGDVDIVVITHCHGDHIGWNISYPGDDATGDGATGANGGANDNPALTFPNATYWIASHDWEHYTKSENANPAFDRSVRPLEALGALKLVEGVEQIAPGISTLPTNGHTPGHQCVLIESGDATGVITGDLFHNVAQITEQTWCPVFDLDTTMSTHSRRSLLTIASAQEWVVFTGHFPPGSSIGHVISEGGKSAWKPI